MAIYSYIWLYIYTLFFLLPGGCRPRTARSGGRTDAPPSLFSSALSPLLPSLAPPRPPLPLSSLPPLDVPGTLSHVLRQILTLGNSRGPEL